MDKRKVIISAVAVCAVMMGLFVLLNNNFKPEQTDIVNSGVTDNTANLKQKTSEKNLKKSKAKKDNGDSESKTINASVQKEDKFVRHADLYNNLNGSMLPLSAIPLMSEIPGNISEKISKLSETNNIYMIQKHGGKLFIITDNPLNIRHNIEFTEISLANGHQIKTTLGYNDKMQDSDNDIWEYDANTHNPVRHTKYNTDGDVEFTEVWNYDEDNPIKYEMKDADGRVISLRKETLSGSSDFRTEHLIYDKEGNTKINVSVAYEGADVKRFTYYNADKPSDGGSIFGEYSDDGNKTRETVYTSDLKVKNSYIAKYIDGNRDEIVILNDKNQEIEKLVPNSDQ